MRGRVSRKAQHQLIELKARVLDLDAIRRKLTDLEAEPVGTFRQVDVYFDTPKGRLKLREVEGDSRAELVYYEREDTAGLRECQAFILEVSGSTRLKGLLEKVLKTLAVVEKVREVYRHHGTWIHLDRVKDLGTFVEFERETPPNPRDLLEGRLELERLMEALGISPRSLEGLSYGDLVRGLHGKLGRRQLVH